MGCSPGGPDFRGPAEGGGSPGGPSHGGLVQGSKPVPAWGTGPGGSVKVRNMLKILKVCSMFIRNLEVLFIGISHLYLSKYNLS